MGHSTYTVTPAAAVALSASTTQSLIIVTPGTVDFVLTELSVSMNTPTAAISPQVELYRVASGTPVGTTTTPAKINGPDSYNAPFTALTAITTEPTTVTRLKPWFVPQNGLLLLQHPLGREPVGSITGGAALGIRVITPASVSPNCLAYLELEV